MVNIVKNPICLHVAMDQYQVFFNPGDPVILEGALDELMKNVRGNKMMDVSQHKESCS